MNKTTKIKAGLITAALAGVMMAAMPSANAEPNLTGMSTLGSVDTIKQTRDLEAFTKIRIKGGLSLNVVGGKEQSVSIEVDEDFVDQLSTEVEDGTLIIDMKKKGKKNRWRGPKVSVTISMQTLESLRVDGAIDGKLSDLNGSDLDISINGAGNLSIAGTCGTLRVKLSGAGNIEGEDFKCKNAYIKLSGAGNVEAYASEKAEAHLSGIGNIDISGNPKEISKRKGGFGSIDVH